MGSHGANTRHLCRVLTYHPLFSGSRFSNAACSSGLCDSIIFLTFAIAVSSSTPTRFTILALRRTQNERNVDCLLSAARPRQVGRAGQGR
jgi:hypothetical protein